jgi:acetyl esterase/lipase
LLICLALQIGIFLKTLGAMKIFLSTLFALFSLTTTMAQQIIPLYPAAIPNSKKDSSVKEKSETTKEGVLLLSEVVEPTLTVFIPPKEKANGTAVIICPGGGYWVVAAGHEGYDVAKEFAAVGIAAFVLKYRLPDARVQNNPEIAPLQDAQRAIQLVRERAAEWNIKSNQIGIMGFSAGGHLASTAGTKFNTPVIENKNQTNLRPDFMVLIYPVITSDTLIAHKGSFEKLLGKNSSEEKRKEYSSEMQVTKQTPPTFLVHASDDDGVSPMNSIVFYNALQKNKIPAELHVYQKGGHGFGLKNSSTTDAWMDRLKNWMKGNGWL